MSKYVKNLITDDLRNRLKRVQDALLVNLVGLDANTSKRLRAELREKNIQVMVIKNSLAARATAGTSLAPLFEGLTGPSAICWGSEDIVTLAKEITKLAKDRRYERFETRGGVMDGDRITAEQVEQVSKWPSRAEQLSLLVAQILGPGARLASQLAGPGGVLVSQIRQKAEGKAEEKTEARPQEGAGPAPA
jgi:large subunit ribosomal protein L10